MTPLTVKEAMIASGVRRTKLYELIRAGDLPARKIGRRTIIFKEDVDRFLSSLPKLSEKHAA